MAIAFFTHHSYFGQNDVRSALPLPMVYESVPAEPTQWEYRTVTVDTREEELPDTTTFNELGNQGWLMVGVLDERNAEGRRARVHYYFVRQNFSNPRQG